MDLNQLQEKLNKRLVTGRIQLLCEIEITHEEYLSLLDYTKNKVNNFRIKTNIHADILLSVTMVQIGMREYSEGNYWEYFNKVLATDLNPIKHSFLGRVFLSTLEEYNLFIYKTEDNSSNKYVQNILMHGFVPNNYIMGFFDFAYSFYDRNLFRQLPDDLEDEFDELSIYMLNTLKSDKDSIILVQSKKRPSKTYKLLKCTRTVLADENLNSVRTIFQNIIFLIDKYSYDSKLPDDVSRISIEFNKWVEHQKDFPQNIKRKRNKHSSSRLISNRPYLKLNFDKFQIDLIIPEQKFREQDFVDNIKATIGIDNFVKDIELEVYAAFGAFVTEQFIYAVKGNCFSTIDIIIKSGSSKEYKISQQNYRIFDEDGDEAANPQQGKNYLYVNKNVDFKSSDDNSIVEKRSFANGYLFQVLVDEDTVFYINDIPLTLSGEFSENPVFTKIQSEYKLEDLDGKSVTVTSNHPVIFFKVEKRKKNGTFIWINDQKFSACIKRTVAEIQLKNDTENIGLRVIIDNLVLEEEKTYEIFIDIPGQQKKIYYRYVLLKHFKYKTDKSRYIFRNHANIYIKGNYNIEPINSKVIDSGEFEYTIINKDNRADFLIILDKKYFLRIPIRTLRWRFEGSDWSCIKPQYYWADKLNNDFYVDIPYAVKAYIYLNKNTKRKIFGEILDNIFRFNIGEFVNEIKTSKKTWHYLNIIYEDNKSRKLYPIFKVLRTIWIYNFELVFNDREGVSCDVSYAGDAKLYAKIIDRNSNKTLYEQLELKNGKNLLKKLTENGLYQIERYMVCEDEFGLNDYKKDLKPIYKIGVINYYDISNCKLILKDIYFQDTQTILNFQYTVRDIKKIADNEYIGKITERCITENYNISKEATIFEKVKIINLPFEKSKSKVVLSLEEKRGNADFVYDKILKKLISSEDNILFKSRDSARYIYLYEDLTEYEVEYRRVI